MLGWILVGPITSVGPSPVGRSQPVIGRTGDSRGDYWFTALSELGVLIWSSKASCNDCLTWKGLSHSRASGNYARHEAEWGSKGSKGYGFRQGSQGDDTGYRPYHKDDDSFGEEQTTATNDDIDKVLQIHDAIIASNWLCICNLETQFPGTFENIHNA